MNNIKIQKLAKTFIQTRSSKAKAELVKELLPIIHNITKKFCYRGENFEDVYQIGMVGLLKGLQYYKRNAPNKKFLPYVISMAMGEIRHYFRDNFNDIRTPRKFVKTYCEVNEYIQNHAQENKGQSPSLKQIAKAVHKKEEVILEAMDIMKIRYIKDEEPVNEELEDTRFAGKLDSLLFLESVMRHLPYREQRILQLYFLRNATQQEIAKRYKISQVQVYRIISSALEHCKRQIDRACI